MTPGLSVTSTPIFRCDFDTGQGAKVKLVGCTLAPGVTVKVLIFKIKISTTNLIDPNQLLE